MFNSRQLAIDWVEDGFYSHTIQTVELDGENQTFADYKITTDKDVFYISVDKFARTAVRFYKN